MDYRHDVDLGTRFQQDAPAPTEKTIEIPDQDPLQEHAWESQVVTREPYRASKELEDAVNLAIALGRPLLLQGDPGTGKTRLAHAVAFTLGLPLEEIHVKSTTRARDLLYTYDAVRRLYDVQMSGPDSDGLGREAAPYVRLGPLGRAIARAAYGRRSVVLIDEIDKADIDFPNDLLRELDRPAFEVAEVPKLRWRVPQRTGLRPIVIVTNNEEKALPNAFLRRCVFHFVTFPESHEDLDAILSLHNIERPELRAQVVHTFRELRGLDLAKRPGISELLDWVNYLDAIDEPVENVASVPHLGAVVKQRGDQLRVAEWQRGRTSRDPQ
ncbi:AAA family ATPase [Dactylosporangium cerinum]|uniref:AAA family ATPase n=1 Tax=Dactylosporangium cerinum TaxID=1434730 RepID=A0ABV9W8T9_9ACTN